MSQLPPNLAGYKAVSAVIAVDSPCHRCGYSLKGLKLGDRCPECAHPIALSRASFPDFSDLPLAVLTRLSSAMWMLPSGAALIVLGALVTILSTFFFPSLPAIVGPSLLCTGVAIWITACWLLTSPMDSAPPWITGSLSRTARWSSMTWIIVGLSLFLTLLFPGPPAPAPVGPAFAPPPAPLHLPHVLTFIGIVGGCLNVILICIHTARIADWAEDESTARRLRWGWIPALFPGLGLVYLTAVLLMLGISFGFGPLTLTALVVVAALAILCYLPILLGAWNLAFLGSWAIVNRNEKDESIQRRARKLAERFKAPPTNG
jgi:hypothetical protein